MTALNIYNLYPRLYKNITEWGKRINIIAKMGFNSIYINSFHSIGSSRNLYAIKNYYEYNGDFFIKDTPPKDQLIDFIKLCEKKDIVVIMDLVVSHSSIENELIKTNKNWYDLNENDDIEKPGSWLDGKWTIFNDLASFNFDSSPDKENLWNYFLNLCKFYLDIGFKGFRCDAAYQVSSDFWNFLITRIKNEYNDTLFLAETLGCTPVQIQSLSNCGFDYIFNSSKWWNFNDPWCLEQYELTRQIAPSISFPETHNTPRLMEDLKENKIAFLQRLYFSAIFSKGFMIISGFEYGLKNKIDSIQTNYKDWENTNFDFTENIKNILDIKKALKPLHEESTIIIIEQSNWINVFCFVKDYENQKVMVCINKDINNNQNINLSNLKEILKKDKIRDFSPGKRINGYINDLNINLLPGELKIFADENDYNS